SSGTGITLLQRSICARHNARSCATHPFGLQRRECITMTELTTCETRQQRRAAARTAAKRKRTPPQFDGPLPLLCTFPRTAHELGISKRHVYDLVDQNELELVHVGERSSRITRESILRLAAKRSTPKPVKHLIKDK